MEDQSSNPEFMATLPKDAMFRYIDDYTNRIEGVFKTEIPKDSNKNHHLRACWILAQINRLIYGFKNGNTFRMTYEFYEDVEALSKVFQAILPTAKKYVNEK